MSGLELRRVGQGDIESLYALLQGKAALDGASDGLRATVENLEIALFAELDEAAMARVVVGPDATEAGEDE
jgi:hypothetical protein